MKNPNGYGGIIKLGGKRRNPWAVRVTRGWEDGRQVYDYISYHPTQKEAAKALADYQINPISPKHNITLSELFDEWKVTPAYTTISSQLQDNYNAAYKHLSSLHNNKFTELRTAHYQKVIDNMTRKDKNGEIIPLSKSSKSKAKVLVSLLYKYAMENDICNKNYAEFIRLDKEPKQGKEIFSDLEIQKLINNDKIPYVDTILILIYTGMRIGELLGLTKFAVDLKNNTITGGLKTDAGKDRVIPIHPKIQKYVRKWYSQSQGPLIFKDDYTPISPDYYRKYIYYPLLEQLEISRKTPHATRHTCATLLAKSGADTLAIKQFLGHTDYSFTANVYTHENIEFLQSEIQKM